MRHFESLTELHRANGFPPPENPMFSLVRHKGSCLTQRDESYTGNFYMIGMKNVVSDDSTFGRTRYDHEYGALFFMKPNQVVSNINCNVDEDGFVIYLHQDFLNGHPLHHEIKRFGYFDYGLREALHLSERENQIIWTLFRQIVTENQFQTDGHSKDIILTQISTILHYAQRFYMRQFINRKEIMGQTMKRFHRLLNSYFESGHFEVSGLPSVKSMADQLHLTPRYLSDLLRQETGKSAMELIHLFLMSEAKNLLKGKDLSVKEIAYKLGFVNRPYFSRLFKKQTGLSPYEFKRQFLN